MQLPSPQPINPRRKQNNMPADTYVRTVEHRSSSISSKQHLRCSDSLSQQRKVKLRSKAAERCSNNKTVPGACTQQQQHISSTNNDGKYSVDIVSYRSVQLYSSNSRSSTGVGTSTTCYSGNLIGRVESHN